MTDDTLFPPPTDWRQATEPWPPEWRVAWSERAAVLEYDIGNDRDTAERVAFAQTSAKIRKGETP